MQTTYYIVLLNGVPVDVSTIFAKAQQSQKELSVPGKDAIILPCVPIQREFDFAQEEPTDKDCVCRECEFVREV